MGKKALRKDFYVEIKRTFSRFLSIFGIVALGVAFYVGIRSTQPDMLLSADKQYDEASLLDIKVISLSGISEDDLDEWEDIQGIEKAEGVYSADFISYSEDVQNVVKVISYTEESNRISLVDGRLPESTQECVLDSQYMEMQNYEIGDEIIFKSDDATDIKNILSGNTFTVVGTFTSPEYLSLDKGTSMVGNGKVEGLAVVTREAFYLPYYTQANILVTGAKDELCFSDDYEKLVDGVKEKITDSISGKGSGWFLLDRNSIQSYAEYDSDAQKVGKLGDVFPVIFFLVAALVSLTTMTRMVEEQRVQIGTLKALGYGKASIAFKYVMYGLGASVAGSLIGGYVGSKVFPAIIIDAYKIMYLNLHEMVLPVNRFYFFSATLIAIFCVVFATVLSCYKELLLVPANLMRPPAPKQGKRILLEKVPIIWNRLSFTWKSTIRNFVRYKKRLFMTLFGISGCMALLLVGFGLRDSINSIIDLQYGRLHLYDAIVSFNQGSDPGQYEEAVSALNQDERIEKIILMQQSSASVSHGDEEVNGYIVVPQPDERLHDFIELRDIKTEKEISLNNDSVAISQKLAKLLGVEAGEKIKLKISETDSVEVEVGAIFENYVYHYVYMTDELYRTLYNEEVMYNEAYLINEGAYKEYDDAMSAELLSYDAIGQISYIEKIKDKFSDMLGSLDIIIVVLVVSAGGLAFIVLYNLNNINISERRRELATLKVLGFYDIELCQYIYRENIIITVIGMIGGCILGVILHRFVIATTEIEMIMFGRNIEFLSYLYSILLTLLFSFIINLSMVFKLKKIDMAASLKSVE